MTPLQQRILTTAMLLGGTPTYNDYGHPERANSRQYWSIRNNPPDAYGFSAHSCARAWLLKKGWRIEGQELIPPPEWRP